MSDPILQERSCSQSSDNKPEETSKEIVVDEPFPVSDEEDETLKWLAVGSALTPPI